MSCQPFKIGNVSGVMCSRGQTASCQVVGCYGRTVALCDFPLDQGTCDRRLCAAHRVPQRRLGPDRDYCPVHDAFARNVARGVCFLFGWRWG